MNIGWIYHVDKNGKARGFGDLVRALAKAPHESLFSTDLVTTLIDNFWEEYATKIKRRCLYPFIIYFIACAIYFTTYCIDKKETTDS